jgi:prepilin-type N-terminal cleavage/methylation domain-containing protein
MRCSQLRSRCSGDGFTLIELLLVLAILGVLTTMALAFMRSASEQAREAATRARIKKIESILNSELERYEVRRLPIRDRDLVAYIAANNSVLTREATYAKLTNLKLRILLDLINCELPRPLLVNNNPLTFAPNPDLGVFPSTRPAVDADPPNDISFAEWLENNYRNPVNLNGSNLTLAERLASFPSATIQSWGNAGSIELPGEFIFQILKKIDFDGIPAIESLGSSAFADTNNNSFPEVVDAWGEPLLMLILQVNASEAPPENWVDSSVVDWTREETVNPNTRGLPIGTTTLNPVIPRDLHKIKIIVFSSRMGLFGNGS